MNYAQPSPDDGMARVLGDYRPAPGVPDELIGHDGQVRPVWRDFVARLATLTPGDLAERIARGAQYLQDAGVYYRRYDAGDTGEREWPLSYVPLLLDAADWRQIEAGLAERADLLERVMADLYGDNRLVADGFLPPRLVAANPEWLRPLVGVQPPGGHYLQFLAFDIGRGPDGKWWVLGDRTQAPSGAGFALENRIATARIYSDIFAEMNVERLAGFFRAFRDTLLGMRRSADSRAAILTPGPLNDTYFEHAYIARYLGIMLLEGEDLVVQQRQLMVRTISGPKPIEVLWRRLDAAWADPLMLNDGSRIGTPGLVSAVRSGSVGVVNALGSGVLETQALLAFLPRIAEAWLGRPLALPNIATWWCGQPAERAHVLANADRMSIGPALSTRLPFELEDTHAAAGQGPEDLTGWIEGQGDDLVGQEVARLSTAPALVEGRLVPRPMILRVFLARTATGWQAMPGGFARIGRSDNPTAVAMQQGGRVADVWIVGDRPVTSETMLPRGDRPFSRAEPGVLPSRAADNLFWLGRYVERAEHLIRNLRAYHARLAERGTADTAVLDRLTEHLASLGLDASAGMPELLLDTLASANRSASHVRDRFSVDGYMALVDIERSARRLTGRVDPGDQAARSFGALLRQLSGFSGLVNENMYRFTGWRFLSIGRSLERALSMTRTLIDFADPAAPDGTLELAIEIGDSVMSHRRRYTVATSRETVLDLLALDPLNPRSVIYQFDALGEHVRYMPDTASHRKMTPLERTLLQTRTTLAVETPETLGPDALGRVAAGIAAISDELTLAYLT